MRIYEQLLHTAMVRCRLADQHGDGSPVGHSSDDTGKVPTMEDGDDIWSTNHDAAAVLSRYAENHPAAWRRLRQTLELAQGSDDPRLPTFALDLGEHA